MGSKAGDPLPRAQGPIAAGARAALETLLAEGCNAVLIRVERRDGTATQLVVPDLVCVAVGLDQAEVEE